MGVGNGWLSTPDDDDEGSSPSPRNRACVCVVPCVFSVQSCVMPETCVFDSYKAGSGWRGRSFTRRQTKEMDGKV